MTLASHALAPSFTHTSAAPDVVMKFMAGVSPVNVNLATGAYRMALAPSASDYLRALAAAIVAALDSARGVGYSCTITLSAAGVATLVIDAGLDDPPYEVEFADLMWKRLGFASSKPGGIVSAMHVAAGTRPVWYLALLSAATGPYWQPKQAGGAEITNAGRVYAFAASVTSWQRELKVTFQPTTPTLRTALGCDATAMYPAEAYMGAIGSTATAREWSVLDCLVASRNALCGYTSTWGTARTSTSERLWRVYVAPEGLLSTATALTNPSWLAYCEWTLALSAPSSTPTETRA